MSDTTIRTYLADHPRAIGVLFLIGLLLVQTQPVAAGAGYIHGP